MLTTESQWMPQIYPPQLEIAPYDSGNFNFSIHAPSDYSGYQTFQLQFKVQVYPYRPDAHSSVYPLDIIFYYND